MQWTDIISYHCLLDPYFSQHLDKPTWYLAFSSHTFVYLYDTFYSNRSLIPFLIRLDGSLQNRWFVRWESLENSDHEQTTAILNARTREKLGRGKKRKGRGRGRGRGTTSLPFTFSFPLPVLFTAFLSQCSRLQNGGRSFLMATSKYFHRKNRLLCNYFAFHEKKLLHHEFRVSSRLSDFWMPLLKIPRWFLLP